MTIVSKNYFASFVHVNSMAKLVNRRQLSWCLRYYSLGEVTSKCAAKYLGISQRRFQQVYKQYKQTGKTPMIKQRAGGRPKKEISQEWKNLIKQQYEQTRCNALYLEKKINHKRHIHISHCMIHEVLLGLGYAEHEAVKQKRRKPWIRYERTHSLSLVHMDYHYCKDGKYLCTVLDDASRKVLAAGEFDHKTSENALLVLKQAQSSCDFHPILAVLTDHGSEFYANKRDEKGHAEHGFELYLKEQGILHILCGVNHPQTNGKVEKWHDLYIHHRDSFSSLEELLLWYNEEKPHGALNLEIAETPGQAFIRKMRPEVW